MKRWSWLFKPVVLIGSLTGLVFFAYAQAPLQVGYAILTADAGSNVPVATALFSSTNSEGTLIWEAGVAAVEPISSGRIFVDQQGGSFTALALVNPSSQIVVATLILRDAAGAEVDRQDLSLSGGTHEAVFVNQLFSGLENFAGSMSFQTPTSSEKLAAVTLRQSTNLNEEAIFATLPVVDLTAAATTESLVFPQVGAGVGLSTQIVLINPGEGSISGQIQLFDDNGNALELELDGTSGSAFPYQIEGNGTFQGELTADSGTHVGYARVTLEQGEQAPSGTAIFQFKSGEALISEAGVAAVTPTTSARIFVDRVGTQTGVAIANSGNPATTVTFKLLDINGTLLQTTTRDLAANGHLSILADQLFSEAGEGFAGIMEITSAVPIAPVTLKFTTNSRDHSILTTLPLADLTQTATEDSLIFPQIGFGESDGVTFSTRLILINRETAGGLAGRLDFFQSDGSALSVPLDQKTASDFPYLLAAGGGRQLRPGTPISGSIAEIILDPANPASLDMVVNVGNALQLTPSARDEQGNPVEEVSFSYRSLDTEVATIDAFGTIEGKTAGFSTLTVTAGGVVKTATITVVKVNAGATGFRITGVAQDRARRLYLANTADHTILLAEDLEAVPEVYAGVTQTPGFKNDARLESLFENPAFLALDQARGNLYVSDGSNHRIRRVEPGSPGQVTTLAGTDQSGSGDGSLDQAAFNNPQGVALDNRGNLWVADSDNHTIRRINLVTGMVVTVAGQAGSAGFTDGTGEAARFSSPSGIALERESVAEQLDREAKGEPPPAVAVIVADTGNGALRRVKENGEVETIGALAQGTSGKKDPVNLVRSSVVFNSPTGVALDPFGNIYITEPASGQVRTILPSGDVVAAVQAGTFVEPRGVVIAESGKAIVTDINASAQQIELGKPDISSLTPDAISSRGGDTVTIRGRNFTLDSVLTVAGSLIEERQVLDTRTITFSAPILPSGLTTITVQNRGGLAQSSLLLEPIPLNELPPGHITTVVGGTTFVGDGSDAALANLSRPTGVALDTQGNLFVVDQFHFRIRKVDAVTGIIITVAGSGEIGFSGDGGPATAAVISPEDVAVDGTGNLFIASGHRIRRVDVTTGIITTFAGTGESGFSGDGGPATEAVLNFPNGLAIDQFGNLFIAENGGIRKVDVVTGIITTVDEGTSSVAVDGSGNLFSIDGNRIRRVDAVTGIITTVAGNGCGLGLFFLNLSNCELFDGGPATAASSFLIWNLSVRCGGG